MERDVLKMLLAVKVIKVWVRVVVNGHIRRLCFCWLCWFCHKGGVDMKVALSRRTIDNCIVLSFLALESVLVLLGRLLNQV